MRDGPLLLGSPRSGIDHDQPVTGLHTFLREEIVDAARRIRGDGHVEIGSPRDDAERAQQGQVLLDNMSRLRRRRDATVREEGVAALPATRRAEPDAHGSSRVGGEEAGLEQALQIDGDVEARVPDARAEATHLAPHLSHAGRPPDHSPPQTRVHGHHGIEIGMIAQDGVLARLHDPRQLGIGQGAPEGARHREGVDHVTQRGQLDDGDARGAQRPPLPNRSTMVRMRSRVAWVFGSPAMATFPPAASTAARSGTVSAV